MRQLILLVILCLFHAGCTAFPDVMHEPQFHNPYPQLNRVAVLPFFNQSADPTVDQDRFAIAYYNELQKIAGFEVMPVGVAKQLLKTHRLDIDERDFQKIAKCLGVDALVVGSITEYSPYYPPRLGISVDWYAANPCFHPIPPGYGLPWGTSEEEYIPDSLVFEAEFALAKEQLKTQTPNAGPQADCDPANQVPMMRQSSQVSTEDFLPSEQEVLLDEQGFQLPVEWPDPRGFIPQPPSPVKPACFPQSAPVMSLTRVYDGADERLTQRLANYFYFRDDARFGGWEAYLQRSDDFIRFCSYLHITELLAARGGAGKTRVVLRWPIDRYDR